MLNDERGMATCFLSKVTEDNDEIINAAGTPFEDMKIAYQWKSRCRPRKKEKRLTMAPKLGIAEKQLQHTMTMPICTHYDHAKALEQLSKASGDLTGFQTWRWLSLDAAQYQFKSILIASITFKVCWRLICLQHYLALLKPVTVVCSQISDLIIIYVSNVEIDQFSCLVASLPKEKPVYEQTMLVLIKEAGLTSRGFVLVFFSSSSVQANMTSFDSSKPSRKVGRTKPFCVGILMTATSNRNAINDLCIVISTHRSGTRYLHRGLNPFVFQALE